MRTKKTNITAESLSTLVEQAVANARTRRAQVIETAELEQVVGGLARDAGAEKIGIKIGGGSTMGMRQPDPDLTTR